MNKTAKSVAISTKELHFSKHRKKDTKSALRANRLKIHFKIDSYWSQNNSKFILKKCRQNNTLQKYNTGVKSRYKNNGNKIRFKM